MGKLKRLDIFQSINSENKNETTVGSLITIACLLLICAIYVNEYSEYKHQKLNSKVLVMNLDYHEIMFTFDIEIYKVVCEYISAKLEYSYDGFDIKKESVGDGCRIKGNGYIRSLDNNLVIVASGWAMINRQMFQVETNTIDMSHKIHEFQLGRSVSAIKRLAEKYPNIKVKPLVGAEYKVTPGAAQNSVFMYEVNILIAKAYRELNVVYNYNKNGVTAFTDNSFVKFKLDFSPIAIEYEDKQEDFLEFLTYLFGVIGGVLSLVKILYNLAGAALFKQRFTESSKMEFEMPQ